MASKQVPSPQMLDFSDNPLQNARTSSDGSVGPGDSSTGVEELTNPLSNGGSEALVTGSDYGGSISASNQSGVFSTTTDSNSMLDMDEEDDKLEKAARDRKASFALVALATVIAVVAGILTGLIIFLFSVSQLETSALSKGEAVMNGAVGQVRFLQNTMEQTVESLEIYVNAVAQEHDWSDPGATRTYLNNTFFYAWNSALQSNTSLYGWGIRALYPSNSSLTSLPAQDKAEQVQTGCFDLCRRPGIDPLYTGIQSAGVWYDLLKDGSKDYQYAISQENTTDEATSVFADVYRVKNNPDGTDFSVTEKLYHYRHFTLNGNGSFMEGQWQPVHTWAAADGSFYYYLTYNKMIFQASSGTSVTLIAWDVLQNWYQALVNVIEVSDKEQLMMTDGNSGQLLAFSGDQYGDERLRTCTQDFSNVNDAGALCDDLRAKTHYHWFPPAVYAQYESQVQTVVSGTLFSEWTSFDTSPESSKSYLVILQEVWNKDRLRVVASYAIHRSKALGNLQNQSLITVILAALIILVASLLLAAIGVVAVNKTHETVDVAALLAVKIARYDVDGAETVLKEKSTGNDLLNDYFMKIIHNLRAYRPFLPRSLMQNQDRASMSGSTPRTAPSSDTIANVEARMEELAEMGPAPGEEGYEDLESDGIALEQSNAKDEKEAGDMVSLNRLKAHKFKAQRGTIMVIDWDNLPTHEASIATRLVKVFLNLVMKQISNCGGVVDVLQANRLVATFNYHSPILKHTEQACRCANRIRAKIAEDPKGKHMNVVIAITSGFNLVGTCGTEDQKSRVVVGESVDLANRLPPLQRALGCAVIVTEAVAMGTPYMSIAVDYIRPTWHQQQRMKAVTLFELFPERGDGRSHPLSNIFQKLKLHQFDEANAELDKLLDDDDYCENYHLQRLKVIMDTNYNEWQATDSGYGRREVAWEPLEGADFSSSHQDTVNSSTNKKSTSELLSHGSVSDLKDALQMKTKLEEAKKEATEKETSKLVEQDPGDIGGGLFSVFIAEPQEPATKADADPEPTGVLADEFIDVSGEKWIRTQSSIGAGQFGEVYVAMSSTGLLGAVKAFNITKAKDIDVDTLVNEVKILSEYRHEYIAGYVSCGVDKGNFVIIMEYMAAGSVRKMLNEVKRIPPVAVQHYICDVLRGLCYLHEKGVTHCDLKPDNVLLAGDGTAKLADFGTAKLNAEAKDGVAKVRGTPRYMAPEAALGEWEPAADIYSLGLVIIEMYTGVSAWHLVKGDDTNFLMRLSREQDLGPDIPNNMEPLLQAAAEECCQRDPSKRPTAHALLEKLSC